MLVLGIILIIIGAILALVGRREGEPFLFYGGVIVFAGGALLFILAILDTSGADVNTHAAIIGLAMAVPPIGHVLGGAGRGEESVPVAGSVTDRQPVLVAFAVAAVPIVAAFVLQVFDLSGLDTPLWLRTVLTGAGALVGALAAAWARAQVTPTAEPRLDDRTPLVPMVESEHV